MSHVRFEVDVAVIDETYGLTVFIHDPDEPEEDDVVPCYYLVFKGPKDREPQDVAEAFGSCHQDAMTTVGLEGVVTEEVFASLLEDSVELAGELMIKHGYEAVDVDSVPTDMLQALFGIGADPETDPSKLN